MNDTITEETEEQRAAREAKIQASRVRRALENAPAVALHVRSLVVDGKTERGETLPEWTAPMRISAADDLDTFYSALVEWVLYWSRWLETMPTSTAAVAWASYPAELEGQPRVLGFKAGTTPQGAQMLVRLQAMWLLERAGQMSLHPKIAEFQEDVLALVWAMRGRYPTAPRPAKDVSPRACPVCGDFSVGAEWSSPNIEDVTISCSSCGVVLDVKPQQVARWLA